MADVRILKYDVGSPTDKMVERVRGRLDASTGIETLRRSLGIADTITHLLKDEGKKIFIKGDDGALQEIILAGE
jgi:hypothetical protein